MNGNKYILVFIFIAYLLSDDLNEDVTGVINHDWKTNIFAIGHGMPNISQFENNKPFKALSLMLMKYYWLNEFNSSKINGNISDRNRSFWWLLFLNFYGIVDGYVDKHLEDFPKNERLEGN
tara:strand:+ start:123 stop:485 length:363 start_codon:yes stop_codon:yes gene_type:complete